MENFKNWYENQETINEDVAEVLGKLIGFTIGGAGLAWASSLLLKSLKSAKNSFDGLGIKFDSKKFKEATKDNMAVKNQEIKTNQEVKKYSQELEFVLKALDKDDIEGAVKAFKELDYNLQNSVEIKRALISEIVARFGIVVSQPTPGTKSYQVIRAIFGLPAAKSIAELYMKAMQKYSVSQEI